MTVIFERAVCAKSDEHLDASFDVDDEIALTGKGGGAKAISTFVSAVD